MAKSRKAAAGSGAPFTEPSGQLRITDKSAEQRAIEDHKVECFGMTFENDEARRAYFLEKLREKLRDPEFRKIEGFPMGDDEDILALSDPPYYTACPNPFLADYIRQYGRPYDASEAYDPQPLTIDVSEGKSDALYTAHYYHTKVPPKAIVRAVLHYTNPGDIILDGFAGSGMTGVAAQMCGAPDPAFKSQLDAEWRSSFSKMPSWGTRRVILNDLAPAATTISANYNLPFSLEGFFRTAQWILADVERELGWMYETKHKDGKTIGTISFIVWSEVFSCPECTQEIEFLSEGFDAKAKKVRSEFPCPHCSASLKKANVEQSFETRADLATGQPWKRIKLKPALISYLVGRSRFSKAPDAQDLDVIRRAERMPLPPEVPTTPFPIERMYHGSRLAPKGFTHVHHMFLPRIAQVLAALWRRANESKSTELRNVLRFWLDSHFVNLSIQNRYRPEVSFPYNPLTGVYYIPSLVSEASPFTAYRNKIERITKAFESHRPKRGYAAIGTCSSSSLPDLPNDSIDYVFTDPPFGENIFYGDMNFLVEAWHQVRTQTNAETIVDSAKGKELVHYQSLMRGCLIEFYRVLKPGRWLTMVFHNSSNAVWNAIQEALLSAGFVVADVRTLDKQLGSYRQVTSSAVKQDLVISAYKPNGGLEQQFSLHAGTQQGAWEYVRQHLKRLPVFVEEKGEAETIGERQAFLLFDRMVAFHVQRGATVPLSAAEFYVGLSQRFPECDGMYFLPEQVAEYERRRLQVKQVAQLAVFVYDERSCIQWLRQQLERKPQTYQEIQPKLLKELHKAKHEQLPELRDILQQNFLDDEAGRWYVPDPNEQLDLERLREKALLREFEEYKAAKQKRLKTFRTEAVRAGFKAAWAARDYQSILSVAQKLPQDVVQEDQTILMYFDNASMRLE